MRLGIGDAGEDPTAVRVNENKIIDSRSQPRVTAGLDPAAHDESPSIPTVRFVSLKGIMDARVKPAHDSERFSATANQ
jgi:hypothetical protein